MATFKLLLLGGFLAWSCVVKAQTSSLIVFEHANVIDGVSPEPVRDATVVVRDGKIESIGPSGRNPAPSAERVDLKGRWMLPGLIDAHVHPVSLKSAQNMLKAGVTTGRSMFAIHYVDVGLRELHRKGDTDIPVEGVRRLVRANLDHNVDVIKVFATDRAGVPTSDPRKRMLSDPELAARRTQIFVPQRSLKTTDGNARHFPTSLQ